VGLRHALWVYASQENLARTAIEIFPEGPDGWLWLGDVYLEKNDLEAARDCYLEATERGPELFRPRHNLAAALYYTGQPAAALDQLATLESLHLPTTDGSRVAVLSLMELGRWDDAAQRLVQALDQDPDDAPLAGLVEVLVTEHPRPGVLRSWFADELSNPEHRRAAEVIEPIVKRSEVPPP
jgi:tetratricopeptide (TPR) repeat protein